MSEYARITNITIDRIGVKDGWRSAITVLLKDVALADTGDLVADHL